jgi:arylsulfatase
VRGSSCYHLAAEHPDKLKALIDAWFEEADKNFVLPLDDRGALEMAAIERPQFDDILFEN